MANGNLNHFLLRSLLASTHAVQGISTDVCVPITELTDIILQTKEDLDRSSIVGKTSSYCNCTLVGAPIIMSQSSYSFLPLSLPPSLPPLSLSLPFPPFLFTGSIIGHVGDGNFHTLLLVDPNDTQEMKEAKQLAERMARLVCALVHVSTCLMEVVVSMFMSTTMWGCVHSHLLQ